MPKTTIPDADKILNVIRKNMKDNPILTIWSIFIAPIIAGIIFDLYSNGYNDNLTKVLMLIGIVYVIVLAILTIIDLIGKTIDIRYQKALAETDNEQLKLQIIKLKEENEHIIDLGNEEVKTEIIRRVSDLDYHLRLYAINTINLTPNQKVKNSESIKLLEDGIVVQREFLTSMSFNAQKFLRKFVYSEELVEEEPSVPRPDME